MKLGERKESNDEKKFENSVASSRTPEGEAFQPVTSIFSYTSESLIPFDRNYDCFYFVCLVNLINNLNIFLNYIYIYITFKMIKQGFLSVLSESLSMVLF